LSSSVADTGDNDDKDNSGDGSANCSSDSSTIAIGIVVPAGSVVIATIGIAIVFWAVAVGITAVIDTVPLVATHDFKIIRVD
jgi:hypothetical protein